MNNNLVWVLKKSDISKDDLNIIVNLYRPLLGARGQDLYLLMNNIDEEECFDEYGLDYFLNNLEMTEESFIEAKDNLIAYGLLKVWKNSKESKVSLILKKPLSPAGFFANKEWIDFLSLKVGEAQVKKLKNKFIKKVKQQKLLDEISEVINYYDLEKRLLTKKYNVSILKDNLEMLSGILRFYKDIEIKQLVKNIIDATNDNHIDWQVLQYNIENDYHLNKLQANKTGEQVSFGLDEKNEIKPKTLLDVKISEMGSIRPTIYFQLLKGGKVLSTTDKEILKNLLSVIRLNNGVINCLLEYVYFKNNKRMELKYINSIAETLKKLAITKIADAMEYLKTSFKKSQEVKNFKNAINFNKTNSKPQFNNYYGKKASWAEEMHKKVQKVIKEEYNPDLMKKRLYKDEELDIDEILKEWDSI